MKYAILVLGLGIGGLASAYTRFQYQLSGNVIDYRVDWVFVDLFDSSTSVISKFKRQGKKVICYFSAGTSENWRSDYSRFPANVKGEGVDGWAGERWLNTSSPSVLNVMNARLNLAKQKGCYGVDPDNVDGYGNDTGFNLSQNSSKIYLRNLSNAAHSRGHPSIKAHCSPPSPASARFATRCR